VIIFNHSGRHAYAPREASLNHYVPFYIFTARSNNHCAWYITILFSLYSRICIFPCRLAGRKAFEFSYP